MPAQINTYKCKNNCPQAKTYSDKKTPPPGMYAIPGEDGVHLCPRPSRSSGKTEPIFPAKKQ